MCTNIKNSLQLDDLYHLYSSYQQFVCLDLVFGVDRTGFREFQEIRGFRGLNGRLTVVDGVDCVYGVSIWVNANDGNNVGTDRAISQMKTCFFRRF